jgi:hypothetical protein
MLPNMPSAMLSDAMEHPTVTITYIVSSSPALRAYLLPHFSGIWFRRTKRNMVTMG